MNKPTTRTELLEQLQAIRSRIRKIEGDLPIVSDAAAEAVAAARLTAIDREQGSEVDVGEAEERARRAVDRESRLRAELASLIEKERQGEAQRAALTRTREGDRAHIRKVIEARADDLRKRLLDVVAELLLFENFVKGRRVGPGDLSGAVPRFVGGPSAILARIESLREELANE
jgi:hypothetical protein